MNEKEKNETRVFCCNLQLVRTQLMPISVETFIDSFQKDMIEKTGECTQEDIDYAYKTIDRFMNL